MDHTGEPRLFRRLRTKVAAQPGAIVAHEGACETSIRIIRFDAQSAEERDAERGEDYRSLLGDGNVVWIDVRGLADTDEIKRLGESFGLSPLVVADIANVGQRPKCEDLESALLLIARMVTLDQERHLVWEQVSIVVGNGYLLTFQETADDCFQPIRDRIRNGVALIRTGGADLLGVLLLDAIVDGYFPVIERFGDQLESIESEVLESPHGALLSEIYKVKRELGLFRRAAWPLRDALSRSLTDRTEILVPTTHPYLHDVRDHIIQVVDVLESYRELASSLIDVYLSSVSNRTNEVMRVLTIIATIFIPLGFLAGVYGMNFDTSSSSNLPELGWRYGYLYFWGVSVAIVVGLLWMFRRLGWLGASKQNRG